MGTCNQLTQYGPCRKCPACMDTKLRQWVFRMQLEAMLYAESQVTFCTFTYRPEDLPPDEESAKRQMQLFLKRLRKVFNLPGHLRYVVALEKGAMATKRYHWHAILYGLSFTSHNRYVLERAWGNGFIQWKPSTPGRMAYVLKYVIKGGKFLMSRNPGIGHGMIEHINNQISSLRDEEVNKLLQSDRAYMFDSFFPLEKFQNADVHVNKKTGESKIVNFKFASSMSEGAGQRKITLRYLKVGGFPFSLHRFIKDRLIDLRRRKNGKKKTQN